MWGEYGVQGELGCGGRGVELWGELLGVWGGVEKFEERCG